MEATTRPSSFSVELDRAGYSRLQLFAATLSCTTGSWSQHSTEHLHRQLVHIATCPYYITEAFCPILFLSVSLSLANAIFCRLNFNREQENIYTTFLHRRTATIEKREQELSKATTESRSNYWKQRSKATIGGDYQRGAIKVHMLACVRVGSSVDIAVSNSRP